MNAEIEDQKSIKDLPVEVLEEVFLTLDAKSLKNCCLVNKKWNNVIGQSSQIMKKLPLLLKLSDEISLFNVYQATKNSERKFHTIQISVKFPLSNSSTAISSEENVKATEKILKVLSSSQQLKHLSYEGCSGFSEVMTFLSTQTMLTKLELKFEQLSLSNGCLSDIERIQIPLKTLSLTVYNTAENQEKIVAFLSRFTETLEDLTVRNVRSWNSICVYEIYDSVYELVSTKFNKLKSLTIDGNSSPPLETVETSFYHKLRPNCSVKKLVVRGFGSNNEEEFDRFIGMLPNVETLELNAPRIPNDALLFVSNHLKRLTTLRFGCVNSFDVVNFARVSLPSVKTIVFGGISKIGLERWKLIVDALPNIESLSVEILWKANSLSIQSVEIIARSLPNLIYLMFGEGFIAYNQIFIELLSNCKNIKTIELPESAFKSQKSKTKILESVKEHDGLRLIISDKRR